MKTTLFILYILNSISLYICSLILAVLFVFVSACQSSNAHEAKQEISKNLYEEKVKNAISCGNGSMEAEDTLLHAQNDLFEPTVENKSINDDAPAGMVLIPGGEFSMGSINPVGIEKGGHQEMNDARPIHRVYVDPFYIDATEVTNAEFAAFVKATGYITVAERKPTREEFPTAPEENLVAGSVVFNPPARPVSLNDHYQWWTYLQGADWRHPAGVASDIYQKDNYPVVQVAYEDAAAYAQWAGKRLPTEAEWEFAARGGKTGNLYPWGDQFQPAGKWMANVYQGEFPVRNDALDGYAGVAPVKTFPANAYGVYDMAGNVWEWCSDWYRPDYYDFLNKNGIAKNPEGPASAFDPSEPSQLKKVQRGGSFLCTDEYCTRYMSGTRGKGEWRSAANHLGFRCVKDIKPK